MVSCAHTKASHPVSLSHSNQCTFPSKISANHQDLSRRLALDKFHGILSADLNNTTALANIANTIALVRHEQHLRSERRADELPVALAGMRDILQHLSNGCAILSIKIGVDLVEEVEGCGIAALNGEDEGQSAKTYDCVSRLYITRALRGDTHSFVHHLAAGYAAGRRAYY